MLLGREVQPYRDFRKRVFGVGEEVRLSIFAGVADFFMNATSALEALRV